MWTHRGSGCKRAGDKKEEAKALAKRWKPGMRAWVSGCRWQSSVQTPEHLFSYPTHQHRVDGRKWLMN